VETVCTPSCLSHAHNALSTRDAQCANDSVLLVVIVIVIVIVVLVLVLVLLFLFFVVLFLLFLLSPFVLLVIDLDPFFRRLASAQTGFLPE
jgi:hypothetical protein